VARRSLRIRDTVTFLPCFVCLSSSSLRYASDCSVIPRYLLLLDSSSLLTLTAPPLCNTVVVFCPTLSLRHTRVCATTLHSFRSLFSPIVDLSDCFFLSLLSYIGRIRLVFLLSFLHSHFCFICTYYSVIQGFSVLVCVCVCVYGVPRYSAFLALV